jgi:tripartite-type tricarboxylate transporter receptor subunit TctC
VLTTLENAVRTVMSDPSVVRKLEEADVQPTFVGTADIQKWLENDVRKLTRVIRDAKLGFDQ